jgi:hypothetical protein
MNTSQTPEQLLARVQRALARARMWNAKSWKIARGTYRVKSATEKGKGYDVTVRSYGVFYGICFERLCCTCEAGLKGLPCRHGAKVALRLEREHKAQVGGRKRAPITLVFQAAPRARVIETIGDELSFDEPVPELTPTLDTEPEPRSISWWQMAGQSSMAAWHITGDYIVDERGKKRVVAACGATWPADRINTKHETPAGTRCQRCADIAVFGLNRQEALGYGSTGRGSSLYDARALALMGTRFHTKKGAET